MSEAGDVTIEKRNAAGIVTLARPRALNALNDEMRRRIAAALPGLANDPIIYALVFRAAGGKAFCAGGDVRELVALARDDRAAGRRSFADEYRLDWTLECFPKPIVSLIDGLVVGSGVGLTLFGTHRVAGPGYRFAMPETAIGLFPDVGVCHVLSRLPDEIGTYLALTGEAIGRADAFRLGLATHSVAATDLEPILAALADADPVDPLLDGLHRDPGPGDLDPLRGMIAEAFAGDDVGRIVRRLRQRSAGAGETARWAEATLATLLSRSPTSLAVTLAHVRACSHRDLRATLEADYRLACAFLDDHDFYEGVRAMLIDKDRRPIWSPSTIDAVDAARVARYLAYGDADSLGLATRQDMQRLKAARNAG